MVKPTGESEYIYSNVIILNMLQIKIFVIVTDAPDK